MSIIILIKWVAWSLLENINYVTQYLSSCSPRSRFRLSLLELYDSFYYLYSLHLHLNWCSLHPAMLNPAWSELLPRKSSFLGHQPTDHSVLLTDREQSEQWVQHWYENSSAPSQSKQELLLFLLLLWCISATLKMTAALEGKTDGSIKHCIQTRCAADINVKRFKRSDLTICEAQHADLSISRVRAPTHQCGEI